MQWTLTTASPNRGAKEEKADYVRLVENAVVNLVAAEAGEAERERAWVSAAENFVMRASQDAGGFSFVIGGARRRLMSRDRRRKAAESRTDRLSPPRCTVLRNRGEPPSRPDGTGNRP